jgi:uncharacterized caspase-like protein
MAQEGFVLDRKKRFLVLESSAGHSAASGLHIDDVESTIYFLPADQAGVPKDSLKRAIPDDSTTEVCPTRQMVQLIVNSQAAKSSPAATAAGPASTPEELDRMVQIG